MKLNFKKFFLGVVIITGIVFSSCSKDDSFTPTIFDTRASVDYLDKSSVTFPLDTFLRKQFLEPYNLRFIYRMEDVGSDMTKNLTPAAYDKSVDLAVLTKYLWYDVYDTIADKSFMKKYSPRVIQVAGSKNYNPSKGTEVLGDASSGVKINLYNANNLDVSNIYVMNEYFFKTMHHEFAHILDQTHERPLRFNTLSNSLYDASGWNNIADSVTAGRGFVSSYASSAVYEDWAESMANYITRDSISWNQLLHSAEYEWEQVDCKDAQAYAQLLRNPNGYNKDTIGSFKNNESGENKVYRRRCVRNAAGHVILDANGKVQWLHTSGINGREVILQKVDLVRNYLMLHYKIDLDKLRREVQSRQFVKNPDGTFKLDAYGNLENRLISIDTDGKKIIDKLRQWVYQYKALQQ